MATAVEQQLISIQPGRPAMFDVDVVNRTTIIDGLTVSVQGIDAAFVRVSPPLVTLFPEASGRMTVTLDVPKTYPAGDRPITVLVRSVVDQAVRAEHHITATVEPVESAEIAIRPSLVVAGSEARFGVVVTNTGNTAVDLSFEANEPTRALECRIVPPSASVPAGETRMVYVFARGKRPFFSQVVARTILIEAKSPTLQFEETARFNQKPRIPRGVLTALILGGIIALWALIFLFVISYLRNSAAPRKAVPKSWNERGIKEVPLASVAATLSGKVVASTTKEGLARITVEAFRVKTAADGTQTNTLSASGATADDGTYSLVSLLPGTYRVRYSAAGFCSTWYGLPPLTTCPDGAQVEPTDSPTDKLDPLATPVLPDAVLVGHTGSLSGKVAIPIGVAAKPGSAPTVSITLVPADAAAPPQPAVPVTVNPDGSFTAPGLVTPATYAVTVAKPGFDPQTFQVTLAGGANPVIDTAQLLASNASISGTVVDAGGTPLGNVKVTATTGKTTLISVTPTTGTNIGQFKMDNLKTPATYVLTFTKDGFSSVTISLDLAGGGPNPPFTTTLVGGSATIRGSVTDISGAHLGGVAVTVTSGGFTASSTTLTTGVEQGSYAVTNLPVGSYNVSFTLAGYTPETTSVTFTQSGTQTANVTLSPTASTVKGTVQLGGVGLAGVTVTLSDGITPLITQTAATPAGAFVFDQVNPGFYTLTASGTTISTQVVLIHVVAGQPVTSTITVTAR
jgi:Carboxypeptidase regulatory-like domain